MRLQAASTELVPVPEADQWLVLRVVSGPRSNSRQMAKWWAQAERDQEARVGIAGETLEHTHKEPMATQRARAGCAARMGPQAGSEPTHSNRQCRGCRAAQIQTASQLLMVSESLGKLFMEATVSHPRWAAPGRALPPSGRDNGANTERAKHIMRET